MAECWASTWLVPAFAAGMAAGVLSCIAATELGAWRRRRTRQAQEGE